jgi:hypothetical protein
MWRTPRWILAITVIYRRAVNIHYHDIWFQLFRFTSDDDTENLDHSANAVQTRPRAKVSHLAHFKTIISKIFFSRSFRTYRWRVFPQEYIYSLFSGKGMMSGRCWLCREPGCPPFSCTECGAFACSPHHQGPHFQPINVKLKVQWPIRDHLNDYLTMQPRFVRIFTERSKIWRNNANFCV